MAQDMPEKIKAFRTSIRYSQKELASATGVTRESLAAYESGRVKPSNTFLAALRRLGYGNEVSRPSVPAEELDVPIPSIGTVAASSPVNWTDPFESEDWEYVPGHMVRGKGLFSCRVGSDSMMPMLEPGDVCVFSATDSPRIGSIVLHRCPEHKVTIKQLKHDGRDYLLHPLNTKYEDTIAPGVCVGFLVGIIRKSGTRVVTEYDPHGILP